MPRDYTTFPLAGATFRASDLLGDDVATMHGQQSFLLRASTFARLSVHARRQQGKVEPGRVRREAKREAQLALFWRGQFECPMLCQIWLPLHERLSPANVLPQLHATTLRPFLVSNRYSAFVYRDQVRGAVVGLTWLVGWWSWVVGW